MFSSEAPKSEFFEQFVPNKVTSNVQQSFLPHSNNISDYSDYQGPPLNIYNNYNPNFHHHHYYYPNFDNYQGYQNALDHSWIRKYDCESQKEYFIANTPSPAECCDFEVPQQQIINPLRTVKTSNEVEKFFFDTPKFSKDIENNNFVDSSEKVSWENEKCKIIKDDKNNLKEVESCKSPNIEDFGKKRF